ncbi:PREDICTED: phosphoinositide 3-kinase regulatory subunit 6 isoform X2 [Cercocebus atys]|uniref:phosphoinositide 3-kinase regulatory subunit 6 isoform X2 n=1 Tax=Cercocebus atys TaxID=9531 RepID=UPI0005F5086A|nr:PREDICTED: phosphoinositide 3-kinase regulatory subunit 6 isoform X2 [Cercocebus atys]
MESSDVELDLQRSVQAVLRELSTQAPALQSNQGMWRWSLHKKVERDPGKSPALVRILLRELEKAESEDLRHVIIPLLHTVMYVLTKATGITEELYQRIYAFCTRLLTLPTPYCTVALDCAIRLKTETAVPGTLYQRMVIAEQNLMNELYPYQERVFLFVDPELVSASVCSALLLEIEAAQEQQTPEACMRHVVSHALQAALGEACHAGALHRKLQASPRRTLEQYFHAVVAAVEQMASEASPSREGHVERLEEIYCSLLGPAAGRRGGDPIQERPPSIPLPSPYITFHLWTGEEQLWKELVLFLRPRSQLCLSADLEVLDLQGLRPDRELARVSVLSTDSGIERDLPPGADELPAPSSPEMERAGLQRKGGIKKRAWPLDFLMPGGWDGPPGLHRRTGRPSGDGEVLPGVSRLHTARVLVLGDDRMLGRLAQAYHRLRKRETQKFCLTPRLSLQLYYIPVLAPEKPAASRQPELGELATFLGRADPWYQSNVNTLCPAIHKLAEMPPSLDSSQTVDPFILDVITYYIRMGTQPIYFQIYTVKIFFSDLSQDPTEDIFLIELKVKIQDSKFPKGLAQPPAPRGHRFPEGHWAGPEGHSSQRHRSFRVSPLPAACCSCHRPHMSECQRDRGCQVLQLGGKVLLYGDQHLQDEQYPDPEPGPEAADIVTGQGRSTHFQGRGQIRGCSLPRTMFRGPEVQGAVAQFARATGDGSDQSHTQAPSDAHQHILWHCPVSLQGLQAQEEGCTTPPTPNTHTNSQSKAQLHTAALALTRSQRVPGSTGSLPWGL